MPFPVRILLFYFLIDGSLPAVELKYTTGKTAITVRHHNDRTAWGKISMKRAIDYFQAVEKYLGPSARLPRQVLIIGHNDPVLVNGNHVKAYNIEGEIHAEYAVTPPENPALLFHEIGHYFTDSEGLASFLPVAMATSGMLDLTTGEREGIFSWWLLRQPQISGDMPLHLMLRSLRNLAEHDFSLAYGKTFKLQFIIFSESGSADYRRFLQQALADGKRFSDSDFPVSLLEKEFPRDWKKLLSGWFFPGEYSGIKPDDFRDSDFDGLCDYEERKMKLDLVLADTDSDGIADGYEFFSGTNPRRKDNLKKMNNLPAVDGLPEDWQAVRATVLTGKENSAIPGNQDLVRLRYFFRGEFLFVMVETRDIPLREEGVIIDLLFDGDGDSRHGSAADKDFAFWSDRPQIHWMYHSGAVASLSGMQTAAIRCFEFRIPRKAFDGKAIRLLPILRDDKKKVNLDEWHEWVLMKP